MTLKFNLVKQTNKQKNWHILPWSLLPFLWLRQKKPEPRLRLPVHVPLNCYILQKDPTQNSRTGGGDLYRLSYQGSLILQKAMATHSSVPAWRIPGTGEPGGLPSMGSHRVGQD